MWSTITKRAKNMKAASKNSQKTSSKKSRKSSSSSKRTASTGSGTTHGSLPSAVLCTGNEAALNTVVSKVVNEYIFPRKQFVLHEKELESDSKLATKCLEALELDKEQWHLVKNTVRVRLNRKRNNAQLCVRRALFRK